jgi:hypothetical protein
VMGGDVSWADWLSVLEESRHSAGRQLMDRFPPPEDG